MQEERKEKEMTEEQVAQAQEHMGRLAHGLLGTKDSPSNVALFLEHYIQLQKELVSQQDLEVNWRREKSVLDGLLGLATAIRMYEDNQKDKLKQEATDE